MDAHGDGCHSTPSHQDGHRGMHNQGEKGGKYIIKLIKPIHSKLLLAFEIYLS
jgi:hypothetical protein